VGKAAAGATDIMGVSASGVKRFLHNLIFKSVKCANQLAAISVLDHGRGCLPKNIESDISKNAKNTLANLI
jgi:hypothetical protein